MNRKIVSIAILLVAVLVAGLGILAYNQIKNQPPKATPFSGPDYVFTSKISALKSEVSTESYSNVTQGSTLQLNLTFTSIANQPIEIPVENLTLSTYSDTINPSVWADSGNSSFIQDNVLTYIFSFNPVIVQPSLSNSTVLTIKFADNAPIGQYYLNLKLGRAMLINTQSEANYYSTIGVEIIVLPNQG